MKRLIISLAAGILAGCSGEKGADMAAAFAAKEYYDMLRSGQAEAFVDAMADADSLPAGLRSQLVDNAYMVYGEQQKRGGIDSVTIVRCVNDTSGLAAQVFLALHFHDSGKEEISVDMTNSGGKWKLK